MTITTEKSPWRATSRPLSKRVTVENSYRNASKAGRGFYLSDKGSNGSDATPKGSSLWGKKMIAQHYRNI